jgi:hypothetical protein
VDPEHREVRRPLDAVSRAAYLAAFAEWRAETARAWRDAGATYTAVATTESPARLVRRVVRGEGSGPAARAEGHGDA